MDSLNLVYALILWRSGLGLLMGKCCQFLTELSARDIIFFIKLYIVGTNLNVINKSMPFRWIPITCLYKKVDKKYTGSNLKIKELLHCTLIGVCVVIRSNMVFKL